MKRCFCLLLLFFLSACAQMRLTSNFIDGEGQVFDFKRYDIDDVRSEQKTSFNINNYLFTHKTLKLSLEREAEQEKYDIPIYVDDRVKYFLELYGIRLADTFQRWIDRSNVYMNIVKDIFIKEGLPGDLVCLAFTESGFNPTAVSWANAVGMWQFIESTGKLYGLKNNFWIDDRKDFLKATYAAARHLKDLYSQFGDWYLAIAAYNAGMYKVLKGIEMYGTTNFRKLATYDYFKQETKDYVPKFIAMLMLYKNLSFYGFNYPSTDEVVFETVNFNKPINLIAVSKLINVPYEELKTLNPQLKRPITPPGRSFKLRVPYGKKDELISKLKYTPYNKLVQVKVYYPRKGENVITIARKHNVSVSDIKEINGLYFNNLDGKRPLFIPIRGAFDKSLKTMFAKATTYDMPKIRVHIVKKGDTIYGIAKKYGINANTILALNKNIKPTLIKPGDKLLLSGNIKIKRQIANKKKIVYTVRKGDTLWGIARKFNTSVVKIKKSNNIYAANIRPGIRLVIPD